MAEEFENDDDSNINEPEILKLPATITDEEKSELFKELTTILSRRWIKNKVYVFGSSEIDLLLATRFDIETLRELIQEYKHFVEILGLEVVDYILDGETWYTLKSAFYAPSELLKSEFILLGTIIGLIENKITPVTTQLIKEKLIDTNRMKAYQVELALRKLTKQGYLKKQRNEWVYSYRILIEFGEEEREKISLEFRKI